MIFKNANNEKKISTSSYILFIIIVLIGIKLFLMISNYEPPPQG